MKSSELVLGWDRPDDQIYNHIIVYEVKYYSNSNDKNFSTIIVNKEKHETIVTNLKQKTEYTFQVRAKTTNGWGEYSKPITKTTGQLIGTTG